MSICDDSLRQIISHNDFKTHIYNALKDEKDAVRAYNPEKTVSVTYIFIGLTQLYQKLDMTRLCHP